MLGTLLFLLGLAGPPAVPAVAASDAPQAGQAESQAPGPSTEALGEAYFLFMQGRDLERRNDFAGAEAAYRRAIALVPDAADIRVNLAVMYAGSMRGRVADAVAEAEAALEVDPDNRGAHRILGLIQASVWGNIPSPSDARDMLDQAVGHLERAVDGARDPGAQITLAELYVTQGADDRAIATLKDFLLDQPGYVQGMEMLAGAYERTGQWSEAVNVWADLADRGGQDATRFRLLQATALANSGETGAARGVLTGVTAAAPNNASAWYLLSQIELRDGGLDAAEAAARQIVAVAPTDVRGPLSLADVLAARGDYDGVVATLEPRVAAPLDGDLEPGIHGRLASALAAALQERGQPDAAVDVLEAARRRVPTDDELLYGLAAAYDRVDRPADATSALRDLIARVPRHADAMNYLGYLLADRGESLDEAVGLIERALQLEPDNPSYLDSLGWAYFKQGRLDRARAPLEQAAAAMTTASIVQDHLGDLYFELKLYREAAAAYDRALAGDMATLDIDAVTKKRDRARELAGR